MKTPGRVRAIILNWNGAQRTMECVNSLLNGDYENLSVCVVDNGSDDDSAEFLGQRMATEQLLLLDRNLGFAGGCNAGIRKAIGDKVEFVWLLNNDIVVNTDTLTSLITMAMKDPGIGAVGSVLHYPDQDATIEAWGGGKVRWWLGQSAHHTRYTKHQADYLVGASLLLRTSALAQVGLLDERFFLYWEDTDLCRRLRKAGWTLGIAGNAHVQHEGSSSLRDDLDRLDFHFNCSAALFFHKHHPMPLVPIVVGGALRFMKRLLRGDWSRGKAVINGLCYGRRKATAKHRANHQSYGG